MAINSNHTAEDLNEVKCAIVEKNVTKERAEFLKNILEYNKFTVVIAASAPPKIKAPVASSSEATPVEEVTPLAIVEPSSFTVGVTDLMFNPINAIFGRLLKTPNGHIVTLAYWNQKESVSNDEIPYFESKK